MLPKYANLENDANNFIQASRKIMDFDRQASQVFQGQDSSSSSSGFAPKNEYEEFVSNLVEINTYISQLKTYTADSFKKEYINQNEEERQIEEESANKKLEEEGKMEIADKPRFNDEGQVNDYLGSEFFKNSIRREAERLGVPDKIKLINLHSSNQMVGNGRHMMVKNHFDKMQGGGFDERKALETKIEDIKGIIEEDRLYLTEFLELKKELDINDDPDTNQQIQARIETKATVLLQNTTEYPDFPDNNDVNDIIEYFKRMIDRQQQELVAVEQQIKDDYKSEYDPKIQKLQDELEELIREYEPQIDKMKPIIAEYDAHYTRISEMTEEDYKALKTGKKGPKPTQEKYALMYEGKNAGMKKEIKRMEEQIKAKQDEIDRIRQTYTDIDEKMNKTYEETQQNLVSIDVDIQAINEEIQRTKDFIASEKIRMTAETERLQREADDLRNARIEEERIFKERMAKAMADATDKAKEKERQKREKAEHAVVQLQMKARERQARQKLADLKDEKAKDKKLKEAEQKLKELEKAKDFRRRKAVGALAESVPKVNPIIGSLTKLINLVSKLNILFNSKIKKNIGLLDRLEVEDMISKLNNSIKLLNDVNFDYIVVSIENGNDMLNQLVNSFNKLSFDVSNGVSSYVQKVKGGSRHINNHLQYYKRLTVNENPHPYRYMM